MTRPRYTVIKGSFYILYPDLPNQGPEPDGDTINFLPDHDDLIWALKRFSGQQPDRKHLGTYAVRFEGIDALETHYLGRHQNLTFANKARDRMLALTKFGKVEFLPNNPNKVKTAQHHPVRGFVYANGIESNGRVLGLLYPGEAPLEDGQAVFVTEAMLDKSVNATLAHEGLAYAELYGTMPMALVKHLATAVKAARTGKKGLWPNENLNTTKAARIRAIADLPDLVMFPKLYRRLVSYFLERPDGGLSTFDSWVRETPRPGVQRDDRVTLPDREPGNLHDIYEINGDRLKLRFLPEDLLFDPDPTR